MKEVINIRRLKADELAFEIVARWRYDIRVRMADGDSIHRINELMPWISAGQPATRKVS